MGEPVKKYVYPGEKAFPKDPACKGCYYYRRLGTNAFEKVCLYILIEGERRGCPGGKGCEKRKGKRRNRSTVGADGKSGILGKEK